MAWFQQYEEWQKHTHQGKAFWGCPCYIWSDETEKYYRHIVYYNPDPVTGLNTHDYLYFRDVDAEYVYWCRYLRSGLGELRWSYLPPTGLCNSMAALRDDMFQALGLARPLSLAGAKATVEELPPVSSEAQTPPPDLPLHVNTGK